MTKKDDESNVVNTSKIINKHKESLRKRASKTARIIDELKNDAARRKSERASNED